MTTPTAPDHDGPSPPAPNGGGPHRAGAAPHALASPGLRAAPLVHATSADDEITELLERVIQRIFAAGLLLHSAEDNRAPVHGVPSALDQLDRALNDIGSTVVSRNTTSTHRHDHQPADQLGAAVAHPSAAAHIVHQLALAETGNGDRTRWMATNDADHTAHRALLILQDLFERPALVPGPRQPGQKRTGESVERPLLTRANPSHLRPERDAITGRADGRPDPLIRSKPKTPTRGVRPMPEMVEVGTVKRAPPASSPPPCPLPDRTQLLSAPHVNAGQRNGGV